MNKFEINADQICSIKRVDDTVIKEYRYIVPSKISSFLFGRKEGWYIEYWSEKRLTTLENILKDGNGQWYIKGKEVYQKPHLVFKMSNGDRVHKFFDTIQEREKYMLSEYMLELKLITI